MLNMKLKVAAVTIILAITALTLTAYAANTGTISIYLPGDANHDGMVDVSDAALLALSWQASVGQPNYNPNCDFNNNGKVDISDAAIMGLYWGTKSVQAQVFAAPSTLNLKSKGNWITCRIRLPEGVNASAISADSIKLNRTITAQNVEQSENSPGVLTVKFSREAVITLIRGKPHTLDDGRFSVVTLTIMANLSPKLLLLGGDAIRVIHFDDVSK